ncbi:DUF4384 domain-containing protein [Rhodoplanes sp. SY1]|uniref:DUF4384 domain-containing protein n=1 Tax=Rhodoplanes sp. SY1 TaxID=3166646 RepID=UPI0038B4CFBF
MSKYVLKCGIAALSLMAAGGAGEVRAQTVRDLSVEQNQAYQIGQVTPGSLSVITLLDRPDATYALGESVRLAVKTSDDAYLTVFSIGASGKVTQLFPNATQPSNRVKAGETVEIPPGGSGTRIKVTGPVGAELIKVIATSKPVTLIPDGRFVANNGFFRSLEGGVADFKRDLEVVTRNPRPDTKIAIVNQVIKTVPARTAAAGQGVVIVPAPAAVPASAPVFPVLGASAQTFPLLLATDKTTYRTGERVTIAVTSLQACHLRVLQVDGSGQARQLFPTSALPSAQVGALQTTMISGGPAPQTVLANAAGPGTLMALCTTEPPATPIVVVKSIADVLGTDERSSFDRDLAVVSSRPAGTVGFAQVSFTVTP